MPVGRLYRVGQKLLIMKLNVMDMNIQAYRRTDGQTELDIPVGGLGRADQKYLTVKLNVRDMPLRPTHSQTDRRTD